jgi:hypothetical protein
MRTSCLVAVAASALISAPQPTTQTLNAFRAEDMLKVATASILDLTEDGARVAVAIRTLENNATTDHRRFGDPTYVAPSMVDVVVFETRSRTRSSSS